MSEIKLTGELTDLDCQNGLVVIRTGSIAEGLLGHRLTGLGRDEMKVLATYLFEPVEIIVRSAKVDPGYAIKGARDL